MNRNQFDPLFEPGELMREVECFTEHGLDSSTTSILKNQSTKSVVLAPFNSTFGSFVSFGTEVRQMLFYKGDVLKLAP